MLARATYATFIATMAIASAAFAEGAIRSPAQLSLSIGASQSTFQDDPAPANEPLEADLSFGDDSGLHFSFSPYAWIPFIIDITSTVNGGSVDIDTDIGSIISNFDVWGLAGHLEVHTGNWFAFIDGNYVHLDTDVSNGGTVNPPGGLPTTRGLALDIEIEQLALDLAIGYQFFETRFGAPVQEDQPYHFSFSGYAGTRFNMIEQKIDLDLSIGEGGFTQNLGTTKYFFEPLLGIRAISDLNETFGLVTNVNFSGFGVGSGTDLTISALTGFYYKFSDSFEIHVGYRVYSIDYSTGSGPDKFGMDGVMHGPYLAGTIRF